MKSLHIGMIVDHPKRDLPGVAMVAHAGARRGLRVSAIPMYEQGVDVPLLGLDALIINYARAVNVDLVRGYRTLGLPVFVLDTEGGILAEQGANSLAELPSLVRASGYPDLVEAYLFWGERLQRAFISDGAFAPQRLHVTGCPRFDFASERWSGALHFPDRGYVLVNANFPLINPRFAANRAQERGTMVSGGWNAQYVDKIIEGQQRIFDGYLAAIEHAARRLPDRKFLVRPHPFENDTVYRERFAAFPNVTVNGEGSVLRVIKNAAAVVHLNCGTSVEAIMLRRPPISLEYLNTEHARNHSRLPSMVSHAVGSPDDLVAALSGIEKVQAAFPFDARYAEFIEPWFYKNDGNAAERVLDVVTQAVGARGATAARSVALSLASSRATSRPGQRLQAALANVVGSQLTSTLRAMLVQKRREKTVSAAMLQGLLDDLAAQAGTVASPRARHARHPATGLPLASLTVVA